MFTLIEIIVPPPATQTILVHRNIIHYSTQITTTSIQYTVIQIEFNNRELILRAIYKSPNSNFLYADLDQLMNNTANIILTGYLNAKNSI